MKLTAGENPQKKMVFTGGSTDHCFLWILLDWFFSSLAFLLVSLLWVPAAHSGCTGSPDPSGSHIHMLCLPAQCGGDTRRWALTQGELDRAGESLKLYIMSSSRLVVHISEHAVTNTLSQRASHVLVGPLLKAQLAFARRHQNWTRPLQRRAGSHWAHETFHPLKHYPGCLHWGGWGISWEGHTDCCDCS